MAVAEELVVFANNPSHVPNNRRGVVFVLPGFEVTMLLGVIHGNIFASSFNLVRQAW